MPCSAITFMSIKTKLYNRVTIISIHYFVLSLLLNAKMWIVDTSQLYNDHHPQLLIWDVFDYD